MQINDDLNVILKGRKFKKMLDYIYEDLRNKYALRQIEIEIMMYLAKRPNDSASDIYRNLYMNKGHVSQAMNNLCVKGYLNACVDSKDRRYVSYAITEKGKSMIDETTIIRKSINEQLFQGISEEELRAIERAAAIIGDNIDSVKIQCGKKHGEG